MTGNLFEQMSNLEAWLVRFEGGYEAVAFTRMEGPDSQPLAEIEEVVRSFFTARIEHVERLEGFCGADGVHVRDLPRRSVPEVDTIHERRCYSVADIAREEHAKIQANLEIEEQWNRMADRRRDATGGAR